MTQRRTHSSAIQPLMLLVVVLAGATIFSASQAYAQQPTFPAADTDFGAMIDLDPTTATPLNQVPFDVDFYFRLTKKDTDLSAEYILIPQDKTDKNCVQLLDNATPSLTKPAAIVGTKFLLQIPPLSPSRRYCLRVDTLSMITPQMKEQPEFMNALSQAAGAAAQAVGVPTPPQATPALVVKVNQAIADLRLPFRFRISSGDLQATLDRKSMDIIQLAKEVKAAASATEAEHNLIQTALKNSDPSVCRDAYCKQLVVGMAGKPEQTDEQRRSAAVEQKRSAQKENYALKMQKYSQWIIDQISSGKPVPPPLPRSAPPTQAEKTAAASSNRPQLPTSECTNADVGDEPCTELEKLRADLVRALGDTAQLDNSLSIQASTVGGITVRRNQFLSLDIGLGIAPDIDETFYYAAIGIYLRPINKDAPLNPRLVGDKSYFSASQILRRLSFTIGITDTISASSDSPRLKGVVDGGKRPLLVGLNWRVTEAFSIGAGGLLFKVVSPNPLDTHEDLRLTPYVSLSLNGDLQSLLNGLTSAFSRGQQ